MSLLYPQELLIIPVVASAKVVWKRFHNVTSAHLGAGMIDDV